jgi:hypothetical protein
VHTAHSPSFIAYLPPEGPRSRRSQKRLPVIFRRFSKGRALTAHHSAKARLHGPNFEEAQLHRASIGQSTQLHGVQTFKEPSLTTRQSGRAQLRSAPNQTEPRLAAQQSNRTHLPGVQKTRRIGARFTPQQEANSRGTRASTSIESVSTRKCSPCPVLGKHAAAIVPSACAGCSAGPLQSRPYPGARGGFLNFRS